MGAVMGGKAARRLTRRDEVLDNWAQQTGADLARLDDGQRWVVYAGLSAVEAVAASRPLKRLVSFFLAHSEMDLPNKVVGAVIGVSDRAVQSTRQLGPKELVDVVTQAGHGHRQPKLEAHHAGPIAKYLVEHPSCQAPELLSFIKREFEIEMKRHTLARYLKRYGLGCLRDLEIEDRPLFADTPATGADSS
jgi:hypothetical protein